MEQKAFPKIIMHMKQRFQRNENYPISLEEILDELQIIDLNTKSRMNLDTQMLCNNPKLETITEEGVRKYTFKPKFPIKNRKDLINLIKDHQIKGLGGLLVDDVQESMTTEEFERVNKKLGENSDIVVMPGKAKKKVFFYNDTKSAENLQLDEEIVKYWRDVAVDGLDEKKIDEYLENKGITSMKDGLEGKNQALIGGKKKPSQRGRQSKKHNDHLGSLLTEYDPALKKSSI
ncbi:transcription initiation factor IIE subunit beta [Brachionus plicatilis]|uniref:Transcription initiation factor IIE subunit beta n=1 Tax=Brachionus plicatilis TaxID=10195 RepID=A0A3M7T4R5_BRAPC|nr:transcription initiation factor IIE subunit beta [Brachionus plicatilis]